MFKYNELSDLLDGSLVTPLSKTDDGLIRCVDNEGNECFYEFDDFDFDKLPEERVIEEPKPEPEPEPETPIEEKDDSKYDGTDEPTPESNTPEDEEKITEDERFLTSSEAKDILNFAGIEGPAKIWRDIV